MQNKRIFLLALTFGGLPRRPRDTMRAKISDALINFARAVPSTLDSGGQGPDVSFQGPTESLAEALNWAVAEATVLGLGPMAEAVAPRLGLRFQGWGCGSRALQSWGWGSRADSVRLKPQGWGWGSTLINPLYDIKNYRRVVVDPTQR